MKMTEKERERERELAMLLARVQFILARVELIEIDPRRTERSVSIVLLFQTSGRRRRRRRRRNFLLSVCFLDLFFLSVKAAVAVSQSSSSVKRRINLCAKVNSKKR